MLLERVLLAVLSLPLVEEVSVVLRRAHKRGRAEGQLSVALEVERRPPRASVGDSFFLGAARSAESRGREASRGRASTRVRGSYGCSLVGVLTVRVARG